MTQLWNITTPPQDRVIYFISITCTGACNCFHIFLIISYFFAILGLQMMFSMCPSTPPSVTSAVYNISLSIGSLLSFGILSLTAYVWGWYPKASEEVLGHYLGNGKVANYYWLLAALMVVIAIFTLIVGSSYINDIGLNRTEIKHQLLVNEETLGQDRLPSTERGPNIDTQASLFVELS